MNCILRYLTILSFIGSFAENCFADGIQTYRIGWYSQNEAACEKDSAAIGTKFQTTTGFPILATSCERIFGGKLDVVIQYQADDPITPVSTFTEFNDAQGLYATRQECEANLANEKAIFEEATSLSALIAFCFAPRNPSPSNPHPFIMRIDGFGTPKLRPYSHSNLIYDASPDSSPAELTGTLNQAFATNKDIFHPVTLFDQTDGHSRILIKYYAPRRQSILTDLVASFENVKTCKIYLPMIQKLFEEFGIVGAHSFCLGERSSRTSPLYLVGSAAGAYTFERVPLTFKNRLQCETALPDLISRYATIYESNLVKGFCSYERAELFNNRGFFAKLLIQQ